MKKILTLRVSRRAVGAVVLTGEDLVFTDGRHLSSRRDRTVVAALRYVERLCEQMEPGALVIDAPTPLEHSTSAEVMARIRTLAAHRGIPTLLVGRADVQAAFGAPSLHNRREVRTLVYGFWPQLEAVRGEVKPYVADAAAAALHAESQLVLNPLSP